MQLQKLRKRKVHRNRVISCSPPTSCVSSLGVPWHPQILADQLTLSQPERGRLCPPNYYWHPRIFRPSDGPVERWSTIGKSCVNHIAQSGTSKFTIQSYSLSFILLFFYLSFFAHSSVLLYLRKIFFVKSIKSERLKRSQYLTTIIKFIYSEKATKFCEISTLLLSYLVPVKSKVEISQNFVAFSEYMNFIN